MSTRELFVKNARAQLEEWSDELNRLEVQWHLDGTGARDALDKRMAELRRRRAAVVAELRAIEQSSEGGWENRKVGTERALAAMQDALAIARAGLR